MALETTYIRMKEGNINFTKKKTSKHTIDKKETQSNL